MGILKRTSTIVKSNVNELLDKLEDPAKIVDQAIIEQKEEYAKLVKESLPVLANEKTSKKALETEKEKAARFHGYAVKAIQAGNEDDARKALAEENKYKANIESLEKNCEAAIKAADTLRASLKEMEESIQDMEGKAAQIKAASVTGKAIKKAAEVSSRKADYSGRDTFSRMAEKADRQLAEAESLRDLNNGSNTNAGNLERKYGRGGSTSVTDADLAALAAEAGIGNP